MVPLFLQEKRNCLIFIALRFKTLLSCKVFVNFAVQHSLSCLAEGFAPNLRRERGSD